MLRRSALIAAALALVVVGCSATTEPRSADQATSPTQASDEDQTADQEQASSWTPTRPDTTSNIISIEPGSIPVADNNGYQASVAQYGERSIGDAVRSAAEVASLALADCTRRLTGEFDARLAELLTPEFKRQVESELNGSGRGLPSLLFPLPADDGNGHDLSSAAASGVCSDLGPFRYTNGPLQVRTVAGGLEIVGSYSTILQIGNLQVGAGQDWIFTLAQENSRWLVSRALPSANTNWFPAP